MRTAISVLAICWSVATAASATDLFVDNVAGDDLNNGSSPVSNGRAGPCRTITRALRAATKGDRVIIANTGQPYHEGLTLQGGHHSGLPDFPFVIVGNGATIDGSIPVPESAWNHVQGHIFRFPPKRKSYQQLFRDFRPLLRRALTEDGGLPALEPLQWCLYEREIYFAVEPGRMPQDYQLRYAGHPVGITAYQVRHVIIEDLIVQGFQLDGINAHDGAVDVTLRSVVCRGNGRSGISVGGASRVTIDNCLAGDNGAAQVRTEGYCKTWLINCDLIDNTAPKLVQDGGRVFVTGSERD